MQLPGFFGQCFKLFSLATFVACISVLPSWADQSEQQALVSSSSSTS